VSKQPVKASNPSRRRFRADKVVQRQKDMSCLLPFQFSKCLQIAFGMGLPKIEIEFLIAC
jgi:hypothetical protein